MNRSRLLIFLLLLAAAAFSVLQAKPASKLATQGSVVDRCEQAEDVVVRFYYNPTINEPNLSPGPLILLPVSYQDPRLGTRPGWSLYVTLADLRNTLRVLIHANPEWKESESPKQLVVHPFDLPQPHHKSMELAISCPRGSATAEVEAGQVCSWLSKVYGALTNPKARQSFAHWTGSVSCVVVEPNHSSTR